MHAFRIVGSFVPIDIPAEGHLLGARLASIRDAVNRYAIGTFSRISCPLPDSLRLIAVTILVPFSVKRYVVVQALPLRPKIALYAAFDQIVGMEGHFEMVHLFLRPPLGDGRGRRLRNQIGRRRRIGPAANQRADSRYQQDGHPVSKTQTSNSRHHLVMPPG